MTEPRKDQTSARVEQPAPETPRDETHVPAWAEDIEHTLRRLAAEKQAKREKDPGLYR
ncbi:hypothetical protein P1J78_05175 [Psychromarinibacter sp. C21-152]|uniref:Uncharacterized protein n=1 Tax=Psychromarinibacter sediminicola TaxID=3033385 RepID=A0AAE3NQA1_9RHOB|nr:hypothetical protein [Psychromarinibacter sediminicola]MDF0600116.1 hypothetical protein [Psychromarinibacter sediminicola]